MNGRGNKPVDVIVPEILAEILKEQRKINKVLNRIVDSKSENVNPPVSNEDNRPILEKLKDLADDGVMNRSNKKVKPGRKKSKR